jgi:hypothetical protein
MSVKSDKVKSGYTELSDAERQDVIRFINEYEQSSYTGKINLSERARGATNKSLGPTGNNECPCCGR